MSEGHRPAQWSGPGKRSVPARGSKPEPVEAPETGTSIEVEQTEEAAPAPTPVFKAPAKPGD